MFNRRQALEGQSASAVIYTFTALRLHGLVPRNASVFKLDYGTTSQPAHYFFLKQFTSLQIYSACV